MRGTTRHISVSGIMDPGLSLRTQKALKELAAPPAPQQQSQQRHQQHHRSSNTDNVSLSPPVFDLSRAANEAVHAELLEFFKSTVGENVTSEVGLVYKLPLCTTPLFLPPQRNGNRKSGGSTGHCLGASTFLFLFYL